VLDEFGDASSGHERSRTQDVPPAGKAGDNVTEVARKANKVDVCLSVYALHNNVMVRQPCQLPPKLQFTHYIASSPLVST
jgi:hypothetical protein